jgi:hypothetical protein
LLFATLYRFCDDGTLLRISAFSSLVPQWELFEIKKSPLAWRSYTDNRHHTSGFMATIDARIVQPTSNFTIFNDSAGIL